jgi:hypothetical protein
MSFCSTSWLKQYLESASGRIYCDFYFFKIIISEKFYYLFEVPSMSSQRKVPAALPFCANAVHFEVHTYHMCKKLVLLHYSDSEMAASRNGFSTYSFPFIKKQKYSKNDKKLIVLYFFSSQRQLGNKIII